MKKTILTQRFQFYAIEPYREYTPIGSKVHNQIHEDLNLELDNIDFFSTNIVRVENAATEIDALLRGKFKIKLHNRKEYKRKNTKYFYSDEPEGEMIKLDNWSNRIPTFYTTKERHLLRHYGRPFSSVSVEIHERNITVDGDTISARFYIHKKTRTVNSKFFKKTRTALGFKINFKTGNVISYEGATTPKIRQNNFKHLLHVLQMFFGRTTAPIVYCFGGEKDNNIPINKEAKEIFNDDEFIKSLSHAILAKIPHNVSIMSNSQTNIKNKLLSMAMETFISINKIKVPNDYANLLMDAYPTKKILKKNNNKLIAAILDRIGIKSKSTIRLMHKFPNIDISKLILMARYFGYTDLHKYIHNINEKYWSIPKENDTALDSISIYQSIENKHSYSIRDSEKSCLLKLINEFLGEFNNIGDGYTENNVIRINGRVARAQFSTFNDHLDLLNKVRIHLPDVEMRATNLSDFHQEHLEFSKLDRAIKKGYSIKYVFEDKLVNYIEDPIVIKNENEEIIATYYPVLLKIDAEYTEEGSHMHHCVASYADREKCIIVSVREDNPQGNERVTCEFDLTKNLVQAKYFCNAVPPKRFQSALDMLEDKISLYRGSIKSISKEKIPLIINGVQIEVKEDQTFDNFLNLF
jgi:hypothetical protein